MSHLHTQRTRTASPGVKQVAFDHKCQVIPETNCSELRKLLSLCPTRAQSPPIVTQPSGLIARTISPQLARAKSPVLKKVVGLGNFPPNATTSWKTRLASWSSVNGSTDDRLETSTNTIDANVSAAFNSNSNDGPRLVAPIPARGTPNLTIPFDDDEFVDISPSNESVPDFDDVDAEFQHAISGASRRASVVGVHHTVANSPSLTYQLPRCTSPFVRSVSELRNQRPMSTGSRRKSCLVRYSTPQAPGPPRLSSDGMNPLRPTRSHDRDGCFAQRRRADGVPVVCPSPLGFPEDEGGASGWNTNADTSVSRPANHVKQAAAPVEKSKLSRWRRFRRAISEDSGSSELASPGSGTASEMRIDDLSIKREIQAGRWPFEAPLNTECSCKNCQDKIEVGLASNYEPKWTRAARIRWLEGQEDVDLSNRDADGSSVSATRSTSRTAIQADEVAKLHNETVHPMTEAELAAAEPPLPHIASKDTQEASTAEANAGAATGATNPTGLLEADYTLRREIMARRQRAARQSPVLRHGARSMLRQIEEAERREEQAARARSQSREGCCNTWSGSATGSGHSSPASSASRVITPSTPDTVSTSTPPQERNAVDQAAACSTTSYFDLPRAPPERVRSPLIPAGEACTARAGSVRPVTTDHTSLSMASVACTLEALASPTASPQTSSFVEK